jgi:hypothetical protein
MSITSITAGLTATKAALDLAKLLIDKLNKPDVDAHEVRGEVQEMLIHVVNAQTALGEANIEMIELRQTIDDREAFKALDADMQFQQDGGFYVRRSEADQGLIPYCPVCWKKDGKTIPLGRLDEGHYHCHVDKSYYRTNRFLELSKEKAAQSARRQPRSGYAPYG